MTTAPNDAITLVKQAQRIMHAARDFVEVRRDTLEDADEFTAVLICCGCIADTRYVLQMLEDELYDKIIAWDRSDDPPASR